MTLKQFLYLVIFGSIGYIVHVILPFPYILKIVFGVLVGSIGAAFAFIPIQDRPLDIWIKNFIKRLNSPTQYSYKKVEEPIYFLKDIFFIGDPHLALVHAETKEKLHAYMNRQQMPQEQGTSDPRDKQKTHINDLLGQNLTVPPISTAQPGTASHQMDQSIVHQPFVTGVVKNRKQIPIPGILVTIKDQTGKELRILKTNPYGIFATYSPLPMGDYIFELGDPNGNYFFDTMNVHIDPNQLKPLIVYSKEIL